MNDNLKEAIYGWSVCALAWASGALMARNSSVLLNHMSKLELEATLIAVNFIMFLHVIIGSYSFLLWLTRDMRCRPNE